MLLICFMFVKNRSELKSEPAETTGPKLSGVPRLYCIEDGSENQLVGSSSRDFHLNTLRDKHEISAMLVGMRSPVWMRRRPLILRQWCCFSSSYLCSGGYSISRRRPPANPFDIFPTGRWGSPRPVVCHLSSDRSGNT